MTETVQNIAVAGIVLGAMAYLFLRTRKKASSCNKEGGCGCTGPKVNP